MMATTAVEHDAPQHMVALARANSVRLARAGMKREIKAGALSVADALDDPRAASMSLMELLTTQPRWGTHKTGRFLWALCLPELKTVGSLTDRQRGILRDLL